MRIFLIALFSLSLFAQTKQPWGKTPSGEPAFLYTLTNSKGMEARISNFGAILVSLKVPDRAGKLDDVVLGFDSFNEYYRATRFFGATVGRYANRIGSAKFSLDGKVYTLARNNGENSMHGGLRGFNKMVWQQTKLSSHPESLELSYLSKDGEEGFPGNLQVQVKFTVTEDNALRIDYSASTDKPTVVNLTNHSFFNLSGEGSGNILDDIVTIDADRFTPVNLNMIPTGELKSVAGTPFDFRRPAMIADRIHDDDPQLKIAKGFDHNFVLNHRRGQLGFAARVVDPKSGRMLSVSTTEPGLQFYTANNIGGSVGKGGHKYDAYSAVCIETEHFPDSPNHPDFPSTTLRPGKQFHSTTVFQFTVQKSKP